MPLNSEFRSNPVRRDFRERIHCHELNRLKGGACFFANSHTSKHLNFDRFRCFATNDNDKDTTNGEEESGNNDSKPTPPSTSEEPALSSLGSAYKKFEVDYSKLMELVGPRRVDPADVKLIKEKLFGYSSFWLTKEEPFGYQQEGILFFGNLRGKRDDVFSKFQNQLVEVTGDKYNLFMVEEPNSDSPDPRGGPRVSFILLRKEVCEP